MKTNVKKIRKKCPFSEKIAVIKLLEKNLTFLPTGKVKLFPPGLTETQITARGKRSVTALFHLAVTVVLPSPVTVRHLKGGLQQKNAPG